MDSVVKEDTYLKCIKCAKVFKPDIYLYKCPQCGSLLSIDYDLSRTKVCGDIRNSYQLKKTLKTL